MWQRRNAKDASAAMVSKFGRPRGKGADHSAVYCLRHGRRVRDLAPGVFLALGPRSTRLPVAPLATFALGRSFDRAGGGVWLTDLPPALWTKAWRHEGVLLRRAGIGPLLSRLRGNRGNIAVAADGTQRRMERTPECCGPSCYCSGPGCLGRQARATMTWAALRPRSRRRRGPPP
eukprot:scaffold10155_cov60-Phaeocystis_antarctica.AAC.2